MKRLVIALVMLCGFVLVDFNVKADDICDTITVMITQSEFNIPTNGEEPDYKEYINVLACGVEFTPDVITITSSVKIEIPDTYEVGFTVTYKNKVYQDNSYKFIVNVKEEIEPPVITGFYEQYFFTTSYELKAEDFLMGVQATDNNDENPRLTVNYNAVDTTKVGEYEANIFASDNLGNISYQVVKVNIVAKLPELIECSDLELEVNSTLSNFLTLVTYNDDIDETKIYFSVDSTNVNLTKLGEYEVKYTARYYNIEKDYIMKIKVVDTKKPSILGNYRIYISVGDSFNPNKFIRAYDNYDSSVELFFYGNYATNKVGTYNITATAKDSSGNTNTAEFLLIVEETKNYIVLITTLILGVIIVGSSGALYYIKKKRGY